MRKLWLPFSVIASCVGFWSFNAYGHGGQYRGPGDLVPPNMGGHGDTSPPGGGSTTPGPGVVGHTGRPGVGTGAGTAVPSSVGAGRATRSSGGTRSRNSEGFEQWEFWWEYNKEVYLNLRERLNHPIKTGSGAAYVGRGQRQATVTSNRATVEDVKNDILPALIPALAESDADIVDSAVLAIGRVLPSDVAELGINAILETLKSSYTSAQEAATLSLGVLGNASTCDTLIELMNDTPRARSQILQSAKPTPNLVRAFAALSLGMIGDKRSLPFLKQAIDQQASGLADLKSCAILGLGAFKNSQEEIVSYLLGLIDNRDLDRMVRAYAPTSLAKLGEAARPTIPRLLQLVKSDKSDNDMIRSCVIALGKLAGTEDKDVLDTLQAMAYEGQEIQARHFAFIALAEIGARDSAASAHESEHAKLKSFFLEQVARPRQPTSLPWAGLALSIYAHSQQAQTTEAIPRVRRAFEDTNNPSYKGAMAIGLGLMGASDAATLLVDAMKDSNDQPLKGYLAVALGMMQHVLVADTLRETIKQKGIDWRYRLQLSRALGLMNDLGAVPTLIEELINAKTLSESSSIAQALGLIGDRDAIKPLENVLANKALNGKQRGFAAVALGLLAEKTELPWNALISVGLNYRAKTSAVAEILDIL